MNVEWIVICYCYLRIKVTNFLSKLFYITLSIFGYG